MISLAMHCAQIEDGGGGPGSWPQFEDNSMMQIHDMINNASCKAAVDFRD